MNFVVNNEIFTWELVEHAGGNAKPNAKITLFSQKFINNLFILLEVKARRYIKVRLFCLDCELNCGCLQYFLLQLRKPSPCVYVFWQANVFKYLARELRD